MSSGRNTGTVPKTKHNSRPRRENSVNHIPNNLDWNPECPPQRTRKESNTYASNLSDGASVDYSMSFFESNPWVAQALAPTNRTDDDELRWFNVKTNNIHPERGAMTDQHHVGTQHRSGGGVMHRQENHPNDDKEGQGSREMIKKKMELSQKKIEELKQKQAALINLRNKGILQVKPVQQLEDLQSHSPLTLRNKVAHDAKPVQMDLDKLGNLSERLQNVQEFANAIQALERDENVESNDVSVERIRNRLSELLAKKAQYDNLLSCLEDEHLAEVAQSLSSEEGELLQCPRYRGAVGAPPALALDSFLDDEMGAVGGAGIGGGGGGSDMSAGASSSHQAKQDNRELVDQVAQSAAFIHNKEMRLEEVKNKLEQLQSLLSRVERLGQTKTQSDAHHQQHQEQVQTKNCPASSVMEKLHTKKMDLDQDVRKGKAFPQNQGYQHFQQQNVENWAKGVNGPVIAEYSSDEGDVDYDESPVKLCSTSRVPSNAFQKGRHNVTQMVNNNAKSPHTASTSGLRNGGGGGVPPSLVSGGPTDLAGGGESIGTGHRYSSRSHHHHLQQQQHRGNGRQQQPLPQEQQQPQQQQQQQPVGLPPRGLSSTGGVGSSGGIHEELLQSSPNYASLAIQINQLQLQMEQLQYQSVLEKQQMPNFAPPLPPSTSGPSGHSFIGHQPPISFVQYAGGNSSQWHQHQLLVNSLNQCCQLAIANWHQQRELAALRQALAMLQEESNMYKCGGYGNNLNFDSGLLWTQTSPQTLNNQVAPGNRANNYWDNFRSYSRQNLLSGRNKSNEGSIAESIPSVPRPPASQMDNLRRKDNSESNSSVAPQASSASAATFFTPPRNRRPFNGDLSKHRQSELFALEQSIYSEFDTVMTETNHDPQMLFQLLSQLKNLRVAQPPTNYEDPLSQVNGIGGELDALADANADAVMLTITRLIERQHDAEPICTPEFLAAVVDNVTTLVKFRTLQNGGSLGSDSRNAHSLATRLEASLLRFQGCRLDLVSDELLFDVARLVTTASSTTPTIAVAGPPVISAGGSGGGGGGRSQPVVTEAGCDRPSRQNHRSMELAVSSSSQQFNGSVHHDEDEEEGAVGGVPLASLNQSHRSIETELAEADQTQHNSMDNVELFGLEEVGVEMDNQELPPREDVLDQMCPFPEGAVGGGRPSSRN